MTLHGALVHGIHPSGHILKNTLLTLYPLKIPYQSYIYGDNQDENIRNRIIAYF